MCEFFNNIATALSSLDWPATLQGIGAIWVALIASIALGAWKKQLRATKSTELVDSLTDTVYEFVLLMSAPLSLVSFSKIGFVFYADSHLNLPKEEEKRIGIIKYIERNGEESSKTLFERLSPARAVVGKMKALAIKGEVMNLPGYEKCQESIVMLERSFNQVEAFASLLGNPPLNWENPIVQESLDLFEKIDPEAIKKNLETQLAAYITFAKGVYAKSVSVNRFGWRQWVSTYCLASSRSNLSSCSSWALPICLRKERLVPLFCTTCTAVAPDAVPYVLI